ncbi:MAG: amidohydrolase family protein [Janthinobacterium lividum]
MRALQISVQIRRLVPVLLAFLLVPPFALAQRKLHGGNGERALSQAVDPAIARVIAATLAIDNHAHPMLSPPAMATDRDFDALPVDNMEPETDPLAWRPDYAPLAEAWAALYGFHGKAPLNAADQAKLEAARGRVRQREGSHYSVWVLDQAGIGTMLANRVHLGVGVEPPRFRWVPYDDALLLPLSNAGLAAATPDRAQFFALEDKVRARLLAEAGVPHMPATLDEYLKQFVTPTLTLQKAGGAVAVKFEVAYLRGFDFGDVPREQAETAYATYIGGGVPDSAAYKKLQDFLFRYIAGECGRLGLAVHLHGMAGGGRYFSIAGVDPLLLEPVLNDPRLKGTNFVLLHGGWPYVREAGAMLQKPNFYLDMSQQALIFPAHTLAGWMREWLETYPEKVLFGTDGYPFTSALGWEESAWLAARNERLALGLALTGMERDGEITPARAAELARMVLRGNAEMLYRLR